ncbi:hypothetical protein REPUB_Repub02eG0016100 [Reevesia pubescens]
MPSISSNVVLVLCVILVFYSKEGSTGDAEVCPAPAPSPPAHTPRGKQSFPALIAFGDSILDTGNNNWQITLTRANIPPNGGDFPGGKATGRFGNGLVLSDLIAEGLGLKFPLPAYLDPSLSSQELATGVCFAAAGSGLDPLTSKLQNLVSIMDQLDLFKEYIGKLEGAIGSEEAKATISDSLYLVSSGNNDLGITYSSILLPLLYNIHIYTLQMVNWASTFIKEMHGLGARKFAYLSTVPIGCLPSARTIVGGYPRNCAGWANDAAVIFNSKMEEEITNLNRNLTGAKIVFIDIYTPLLDVIKNPSKYGFANSRRGCCGTGLVEFGLLCNIFNPFTCLDSSSFVFWDVAHPSEKAYRTIVSAVVDKINNQLLAM